MNPIYLVILIVILGIWSYNLHKKYPNKENNEKKALIENIDSIIFAGITALIIITFIVRTFYIPSSSMVPTLQINDFIIVNKFVYNFYNPARHDIVVFHPPAEAHAEGKDFIKRIVAVAGDTVEIKSGVLFINDVAQNEEYILEPIMYDMERITVPKDSYFVMGDNRNNSDDSHVWGFLPRKNLVGKAVLIIFPFNRCRTF